MPTNYDKFVELRKNGMDRDTAKKQVYGATPPPPPAIVADASLSTGDKRVLTGSELIKARNQTPAPDVVPETTPVAPVIEPSKTLGESLNDQPFVAPKVEPVKIEPPKVEKPFMTDVQRRDTLGTVDNTASRDQMIANVGIMAKEDPAVLSDRAKFDARTSYASKPREEQIILDQYFGANTPKTAQDIKTQLASGVAINDPKITNTPAFRQAKFEMDRQNKYSSMTPEQLFTEMKTGIPSAVSASLKDSPNYQQAQQLFDSYKRIDNINSTSRFLTGSAVQKDPLQELSNSLMSIYGGEQSGTNTAEAYKAYISQNPEITGPTTEYNQKMAQLKELSRARDSIVSDLKEKYSGQPLSTILAMAARESEPLNNQINTLTDTLSTLGADIKYKTDLANQEFGFYQKDQEAAAAKQSKLQDLLGNLAISDYKTGKDQDFEMQKMDIQQKYQTDRDTQNYIQDLQKMGVANVYDLQKLSQNQDFQKELVGLNAKYENSRSVRDFNNDLIKIGFQNKLQQEAGATDLKNKMAFEQYKASLDPDIAQKWASLTQNGSTDKSLADLYGVNVGTYEGNRGYDLAGKLGDPIIAPPGARVVEVRQTDGKGNARQYFLENGQAQEAGGKDVGYGNSVLVQMPDGKYMRFSHLQDIDSSVSIGSELSGGTLLGTRGNSGRVLGKNGEKLTPEQLASGRGAHIDIEIGDSVNPDGQINTGSLLSNADQLAYLKGIKPFGQQTETGSSYSSGDVGLFNSPKYNPQTDKDGKRVERYYNFLNEKSIAQEDPNTDPVKLMQLSRGQKDLGQAENKAYKDINTVVGQLGSLEKSINDYNKSGIFGDNLNPITSLIQSNNPWNEKSQKVQAQLQALVPKVARGVFGEVGVLTDQDIQNYMKTLPNIKQTANVQDVVKYALLDTLRNSLNSAIAIDAGTYDVSGVIGKYKKLSEEIDILENKIVDKGNTDSYDAYLKNL